MTWDNYAKGFWNLDHVRPCKLFNLEIPEQQRECFNWSNQVPRWETTEIAKKYGSNQIGNSNKGFKLIY